MFKTKLNNIENKLKALLLETNAFDIDFYLNKYPDVIQFRGEAIDHYVKWGICEGRSPCLYFLPDWYQHYYNALIPEGISGIEHFLKIGRFQNLNPHPLIDSKWHFETFNDGNWLISDILKNLREQKEPIGNTFFDPGWYSERYPDVASKGVSPFEHFLIYGIKENRDPGPSFSTDVYKQLNPDTERYPWGYLAHYLVHGRTEERRIHKNAFQPVPILEGDERIFMIDALYPSATRDSGSLDAINFIRIFQRLGYSVYFSASASFNNETLYEEQKQSKLFIENLGVHILDSKHAESLEELIRLNGGYFKIFFLSRVDCGGVFFETIRTHTPKSKVIFNTVDLHWVRELREAQLKIDKAALFSAYHTKEREMYLCRNCDATIVVSETEFSTLKTLVPGARIFLLPLIRDIPKTRQPFESRSGIGFIGGYKHSPNIDAALYFLDAIWPLLRERDPEMKFYLMGDSMPNTLLERRDPGLVIVGKVYNLQNEFDRIRLTVAPLRYGAGAKGKVVTSLSYGVPCICTPIAAEGMLLKNKELFIGESIEEFVDRVVTVYNDGSLWSLLSREGLQSMIENHSLFTGTEKINEILSVVKRS